MKRLILAATVAFCTVNASAQMAHQFLQVGHIESFSVDEETDPALDQRLSSARMKVHGVEVLLPRNLIIQMPARYLTARDIVDLNPVSPGVNSGLALDDTPAPLASYEATVIGNIVNDTYIAGLVFISQHSLAEGAGYIREITPQGEIHVVANPDSTDPNQAVTRLRINDHDPENTGRGTFAPPDPLADPRFIVDVENPTIHAGTGYPMCIAQASLPAECPEANRPLDANGKPLGFFVMGSTGLPGSPAGALPIPSCPDCDQTKQAPFMPGDYILYSGTLARDGADVYLSAHTVEANVGIYTEPGVNPAYVFIEGSLIGTQGPLIPRDPANPNNTFPQETQDRLKIEGVTTDPSRSVELYAIDVEPVSGDQTLRLFNTVPTQPAPLGRYRLILGQRANALFDKDGTLKGAARELMARVQNGPNLDGQLVPDGPVFANGLVAGQYIAPFEEFIFTENKVFGDPILPNNFDCLLFLLKGSGPLTTTIDTGGPLVGALDPWPDVVPPPDDVNCGVRPRPL